MKAISIKPEYVEEIIFGEKLEEYRTWPTNYRGDILICTTAVGYYPGIAACIVEITDCVKTNDGGYAFKLENGRAIKPFAVKGQQRIYNLDIDLSLIEIIDCDDYETFERCWNEFYLKYDEEHERKSKRKQK